MNDYERIAAIIRYLDEHRMEQPDLKTLAAQAGLSLFHFHRLFARWAGITPKDFLQCLTLAHVKQMLQQGENILDAALEAGLSGPGRLHDLCVSMEAATPGEIKAGGKGCVIAAGFAQTPFGTALLAESQKGVCHLSFVDKDGETPEWRRFQSLWPEAEILKNHDTASLLAGKIFHPMPGKSADPSIPAIKAWVRGTPFQVRVWRALLTIPPGSAASYGWVAESIGQPTAARAVGSAVGSNPVAYLIPCHRVIRETGVIGNYRWGSVRKKAIIAWECEIQ